MAQASAGCWHRVAADAPGLEGPFSLCSTSEPDFQPLSTLLELFFHHPPPARACCPCHPSASPSSPMAVLLILPKLQTLPLFLLNSVLASLEPSSSSLGAFGILILLSNVSADPVRLLTDGDLIIVPSSPSSSSLRHGLEQAEQCRPLHLSLWTGIYCTSLEARGKLRPIFPCLEMCFGQLNRPGE